MFRTSWKLLLFGVVLIGITATATSQAEAGCWWGCARPTCWFSSPCCSVPCYTPYCVSSCDGWYLGWRPGPVRRLLLGPYRWYPAAYCPVCHFDDCCCTASGATPAADTPPPAEQPGPTPAKKPTPAPETKSHPVLPPPAAGTPNNPAKASGAAAIDSPSSAGTITLHVPADAEVIINGLKTTARGTERVYRSNNLKPGFAYDYKVRIRLDRNGELIEEVRNVRLTAGAGETLAVDFRPRAERLAQAW